MVLSVNFVLNLCWSVWEELVTNGPLHYSRVVSNTSLTRFVSWFCNPKKQGLNTCIYSHNRNVSFIGLCIMHGSCINLIFVGLSVGNFFSFCFLMGVEFVTYGPIPYSRIANNFPLNGFLWAYSL